MDGDIKKQINNWLDSWLPLCGEGLIKSLRPNHFPCLLQKGLYLRAAVQ